MFILCKANQRTANRAAWRRDFKGGKGDWRALPGAALRAVQGQMFKELF